MTDTTETSEPRPAAAQRTRSLVLNRHDRDAVQRSAIAHLYNDLQDMDRRIATFLAAAPTVQRQVLRELEYRNEIRQPGNSSPALTGLITAVGTIVTLVVGFYLAIFNGWFGMLTVLTDPTTGKIHGVTEAQSNSFIGSVLPNALLFCGLLIGIGYLAVRFARSRDRARATSQVWHRAFEDATTRH
ncbi:hypothetical protein [Leifsonia sp. NPDC058230]|uniref:hypothetical protein n=1 Tax=Leifsonia sp. NPDC058230 TaxID=3346391 RepID=UPI0036DC1C65